LGVNSLPTLPKDASDRNRTSSFAFTGNKFEFRAVGSSQSCARPAMVVNSIMAESLHYVADELEKEFQKTTDKKLAISNVVSRILKEHKRVIFNGNGYSEEWRKEAEKRGLWNLRTAPEAIQQFASKKNVDIFEKAGILSPRETHAWQNILFENFVKTVAIEAECLHTMAQSYVVPAALEYKTRVKNSIDENDKLQQKLFQDINKLTHDLLAALGELKEAKTKAASIHDEEKLFEQATLYRTDVWNAMLKVRTATDALETMVDDTLWPFPKYSEILLMK
jgi:glutamine synthetase